MSGTIMPNNVEAVKQNLIDAGCDEQFISRFMALLAQQKTHEMLALLAAHRMAVLDCIHAEERQIYCLDYLVNKLKIKENN